MSQKTISLYGQIIFFSVDVPQFISLPIDGYSDHFQFGVVTNKAIANIHTPVCMDIGFHFSWINN